MVSTQAPGSPSARAMQKLLDGAASLHRPQRPRQRPGLPTLPELKTRARERARQGLPVIDQSAGDINEVGQPLAADFVAFVDEARDELIAAGETAFARTHGDAYGWSGAYQVQYPVVIEQVARGFGLRAGHYRAFHTISGRSAIDVVLRALVQRPPQKTSSRRPAVLLDPLAWPGYGPLATALGVEIVHLPVQPDYGLSATAAGLDLCLDYCRQQELHAVGLVTIVPSNPAGTAVSIDERQRLIERAAASDLPVLIDAFYAPLAPQGHRDLLGLAQLYEALPAQVLDYLGVLVGETKVTSSQNKTATVFWCGAPGQGTCTESIITASLARVRALNAYPRPQEALVAYALHRFGAGVHAAMGPRYRALEHARQAMRETCDQLGLPLSIGGSFYGTVALVDGEGRGLLRDAAGRSLSDPGEICETLLERYGLVGAPGGMFSPAEDAATLVRLTAAVDEQQLAALRQTLAQMIDDAAAVA